jgi:hypothetical protein
MIGSAYTANGIGILKWTSDTLQNILSACLFPSIPERRICDTSCLLGEHLFLLSVIGLG